MKHLLSQDYRAPPTTAGRHSHSPGPKRKIDEPEKSRMLPLLPKSPHRRIATSSNRCIAEALNGRIGGSANRRIGESANRQIGKSAPAQAVSKPFPGSPARSTVRSKLPLQPEGNKMWCLGALLPRRPATPVHFWRTFASTYFRAALLPRQPTFAPPYSRSTLGSSQRRIRHHHLHRDSPSRQSWTRTRTLMPTREPDER